MPPRAPTGPRINRAIRVPEVRLIDEDGAQLGVVPTPQALEMARQRDLDLVEVAANAVPPVCKLLDYGRFKYEQTKKEREAKKHQHASELKELRLRPGTDEHDLDVRARNARRFIEEGHKVRLLVRFRGREAAHPEIARAQINRIAGSLRDIAIIEQGPLMEGRSMFAVLARARTQQQPPPRPRPEGQAQQGQQTPQGRPAPQGQQAPPGQRPPEGQQAPQAQTTRPAPRPPTGGDGTPVPQATR
ncbi:MAG: translation initiation factor IF-3 [Chloroflexota bacterium]|nr:translation initiation factor IF-3 [Chloroflexota bacterium]